MKENINTGITAGIRFIPVLIVMITLFTGNDLISQGNQTKATRQSSLDAFKKGDYESAYRQFSELLVTFPRDPLYKYYSGVCLVKMEKDPENAVILLTGAAKDGAVVRTVPADVLFWLGRAQQMTGRFDEAVRSYNDFTTQAGKKAARDLRVSDYIQQCADKRGQLASTGLVEVVPGNKPETGPEKPADATAQGDATNPGNKDLAVLNQKQADQKITEVESAIKKDSAVAVKSVPQQTKTTISPAGESVKPGTAKPESGTQKTSPAKPIPENKIAVPAGQTEGVLMLFRVDPKPVYAPGEKVLINPIQPSGLIYRIQIGVFRNPVVPSHFKGITPVYGIKNKGATLTTYYAGMFRKLSDANKAFTQVKQKGFKDAFIVAFSEGKPVSSERAALVEKEWGNIPFIADSKYLPDTPIDTIPPVLAFRVEVTRGAKPVSEEIYEGMKKLSGTRGLDIVTLPDRSITYLIGSFITYESAEEYADLLRRNGYRDSKVVAWLGKKEIPVDTAKQLFEKLE